MGRFNYVGVIIGQRGTGKSLFVIGSKYASRPQDKALNIRGLFELAIKNNQKILIIDTLDHPAYKNIPVLKPADFKTFKKGIYRTWHEPDDIVKLIDLINKSPWLNNTLIICEDAGKYTEDRLPRPFKRLAIDTKQRNIDLILMYHCWIDTPKNVFSKSDFIQLFKTEDSPFVRRNDISLYEKVNKVYMAVKNNPNRFHGEYIDTRTN